MDNFELKGIDENTQFSEIEKNPAIAYLTSLGSSRSRQTMQSFLFNVAKLAGHHSIAACPWARLRRHHVQAILKRLADAEKAPSTINTYLAAIKGVVKEAWAMKQIDTDNYQHISHIKTLKGSRLPKGRSLSPDEISQLLAVCDSDSSTKGLRDAAIITLLLGCGLRRAEIVALDTDHLITLEQAVKVIGKGNKERLAYMPKGTWSRIQCWISEVRGEHEGPLFTRIRRFDDVTSDRLSDQAIYTILETRREEARLAPFAPHDLRRTFATKMLLNGEDIVTVKDAMGHANIATTQRYDKRGDDRLKQARERLDLFSD